MTKLVFGFLILLVAVAIGFLVTKDPGYVLVTYNRWSIETSLWVAATALALTFFLTYLFVRILKQTTSIRKTIKHWSKERKDKKTLALTHQAFLELAAGNWQKAESQSLKAAKTSPKPLLNYLAAAKAAEAQAAFARRDDHLQKAHQTKGNNNIVIYLSRAQCLIESKQWSDALTPLKQLIAIAPKHQSALLLLYKTYSALNDWAALQSLLPALKKQKVLDAEHLNSLENDIAKYEISNLINNNADDEALKNKGFSLIETSLKKNWNHSFVRLYSLQPAVNTAKRIATAEHWLKKHPNDAALYLCLGRLCLQEKLLGKARDYLTKSHQLEASQATLCALAELAEANHDQTNALNYYRQAASVFLRRYGSPPTD